MRRPDTRDVTELVAALREQGFQRAAQLQQGLTLKEEVFFNAEGTQVTINYTHRRK